MPVSPYRYDVDKAKDLLREAGYPDGFSTELWVPAGRFTLAEQVVEALQYQLSEIGIDAQMRVMEYGQYQPQLRAGNCAGLAFLGTGVSAGDPANFYDLLHSGRAQNLAFYENPALDVLIDAGAEVVDLGTRTEIYKWIQKLVVEEAPFVFLYEEPQIIALSPKVQGFAFTKMSWEAFRLFRSEDDQVYIAD